MSEFPEERTHNTSYEEFAVRWSMQLYLFSWLTLEFILSITVDFRFISGGLYVQYSILLYILQEKNSTLLLFLPDCNLGEKTKFLFYVQWSKENKKKESTIKRTFVFRHKSRRNNTVFLFLEIWFIFCIRRFRTLHSACLQYLYVKNLLTKCIYLKKTYAIDIYNLRGSTNINLKTKLIVKLEDRPT